MRGPAVMVMVLVVAMASCAYEPEIDPPGVGTGAGATAPTSPVATTGPVSTTPTFTTDGCPVDDPSFCEQAAFLANALVVSDAEAVFDLSRRVAWSCDEIERDRFPQCSERDRLAGYVMSGYQGEFFVLPPDEYRENLEFFVEAVDEEYSDELGGAQLQILGVSSCGSGADASHHLVYLVGLGDPESALPGDRFLGTYELTRQDDEWAVGVAHVGLLTDWQLGLDDPLTQIACGDIRPWRGAEPHLDPARSESQPTPEPVTGS